MENVIILTAPTVEEAMAKAREQYGDEYELSFSILEMPKKGFLGLGSSPAKVQVTLTKALPEVDLSALVSDMRREKEAEKRSFPAEEKAPAQPVKTAPKAAEKKDSEENVPAALRTPVKRENQPQKKDKKKPQNQKPRDDRPEAEKKQSLLSAVMGVKDGEKNKADFCTVTEKKEKNDVRWDKPKKAEKAAEKPAVKAEKAAEKAERTKPVIEKAPVEVKDTRRVEFVTPQEMEYALSFANSLFENMKLPARAVHNPDARGEEIPEGMLTARIDIVGDDSGILIGHHGETLDAIQYLVNLCASRNSDSAKREFVKIAVDIEGYRAKREATLRSLARRMGAKALKNRRDVVMEPMNPYERRIIHSEIQGIENLSTHSVGSDENRKIIIVYEGEDKIAKKKNGRRRGEKKSEEKAPRTETVTVKMSRPDFTKEKPVRAKSIDDILLDLSGDLTIGEITGSRPEESVSPAIPATDEEEQLREF